MIRFDLIWFDILQVVVSQAAMMVHQLSKKEASVFPLALDYIYADTEFDLDTEKAYAVSYDGLVCGQQSFHVFIH